MPTKHKPTNRMPISMVPGESALEFEYFLYYASLPSGDRKISRAYQWFKTDNPTATVHESKWHALSDTRDWVSRAKKLDEYLIGESFLRTNPRINLTQSLLEYRDKFKTILDTSVKTRELLNTLLESVINEYKADSTDIEILTLKINNLYKLSCIYSQLNSQNKADYEIWGGLLGLADIAERQAMSLTNFSVNN